MRKPALMRMMALIAALILTTAGIYVSVHRREQHFSQDKAGAHAVKVQALLLTDLDGKHFRASDLRGKVVLVNFWAAWCAPCAEEIPKFVALQSKYRDHGLQVIGVSVEDVQSELRAFCAKNHVNYPIVPGDQTVADSFGGVLGLPTTILMDKDGAIYKKYAGATDFAQLEHDFLPLLASTQQ
jgi:peroxiredoxin